MLELILQNALTVPQTVSYMIIERELSESELRDIICNNDITDDNWVEISHYHSLSENFIIKPITLF